MYQDSSIYEYRILAFVDILGFKNIIQQSACNVYEQKRILKAMDLIHSYKELNDAGDDGGLFHVLMDLIHLQIDLSNLRIFIRGGGIAKTSESFRLIAPKLYNQAGSGRLLLP